MRAAFVAFKSPSAGRLNTSHVDMSMKNISECLVALQRSMVDGLRGDYYASHKSDFEVDAMIILKTVRFLEYDLLRVAVSWKSKSLKYVVLHIHIFHLRYGF